jgi:glycosyltransferase involved in cell wall biosynthesis
MRAWVYTIVRDEALMLTYFLRHYQSFCEKVIIYDDQSTDGTREIAHEAGVELRDCPWSGLDDIKAVALASTQYKEARGEADWVIWVDVDEFIYDRKLKQRLTEMMEIGITLPSVEGFSMVNFTPPTGDGQIYDEIKTGFPDSAYSKQCVFDPAIDISWTTGRHTALVTAAVTNANLPLKLLHYRYLGPDWHLARNARNFSRLNAENRSRQHGMETYPNYQGLHSPAWYAQQTEQAVICVP